MGKHHSKLNPDMMDKLRSATLFSDAEIMEWHRGFLKDFPKGIMTRKELKRMYGSIFSYGDATMFAEHVFATFDSNGDGSIDFRELLYAMNITTRGTIEDKLEWAFNMYDLDGDGFITKREMLEIVTYIYKMLGEVQKKPEDEATPEKRMNKIFRQMDADSDAKLSLAEFMEGARNYPQASKLFQGDPLAPMSAINAIYQKI